jgi:hypothetical protein
VFATKSAVARLVLSPSQEVPIVAEFPDPRPRDVWRPSPARSLLTRSIIISRPDLATSVRRRPRSVPHLQGM